MGNITQAEWDSTGYRLREAAAAAAAKAQRDTEMTSAVEEIKRHTLDRLAEKVFVQQVGWGDVSGNNSLAKIAAHAYTCAEAFLAERARRAAQ